MRKKLTRRRYERTIFVNEGVLGGLKYNPINGHVVGLRLQWTRAGLWIDSANWWPLDVDATCSDMCVTRGRGEETHNSVGLTIELNIDLMESKSALDDYTPRIG